MPRYSDGRREALLAKLPCRRLTA